MEKELLEILVSWVVLATPHSLDSLDLDSVPLPIVVEESKAFFVENVCGGKEKKCHNVWGWYNNTGVIYIDKMTPESLKDEVLVEEITHYLQDLSGKYDNNSCEDSAYREQEAHRVKDQYLVANGKLPLPNNLRTRTLCKK